MFSSILFILPRYLVGHAQEITSGLSNASNGSVGMTINMDNRPINAFHTCNVSEKCVNQEAGLEVTFPDG
jgi:hypothetical protein